jgi:hypothetical protein
MYSGTGSSLSSGNFSNTNFFNGTLREIKHESPKLVRSLLLKFFEESGQGIEEIDFRPYGIGNQVMADIVAGLEQVRSTRTLEAIIMGTRMNVGKAEELRDAFRQEKNAMPENPHRGLNRTLKDFTKKLLVDEITESKNAIDPESTVPNIHELIEWREKYKRESDLLLPGDYNDSANPLIPGKAIDFGMKLYEIFFTAMQNKQMTMKKVHQKLRMSINIQHLTKIFTGEIIPNYKTAILIGEALGIESWRQQIHDARNRDAVQRSFEKRKQNKPR